jgi:hypothetical protein
VIEIGHLVKQGILSPDQAIREHGVSWLSPFWRLKPLYDRVRTPFDLWQIYAIDGLHLSISLIPRFFAILTDEIHRLDGYFEVSLLFLSFFL